MLLRRFRAGRVAAAVALACFAAPTFADFIPTTGTADYTDPNNWTAQVVNGRFTAPGTNGLTVTFPVDWLQTVTESGLTFNYGNGTVTLQSADTTPRLLTLNGDVVTGTSTAGNVVTVGNTANPLNLDLGGASRTFTVGAATDALTVASNISGPGFGITKAGPGPLTLSGTSTYTGPTAVTGGVLNVSSDANLGTPPGSQNATPTTSTPGTLVLASATLHVTASFQISPNRGIVIGTPSGGGGFGIIDVDAGRTFINAGFINNNTGGSARLIKTGLGQLTLNTANNQMNGGVSILGGTLRITGDQRLGVAPTTAQGVVANYVIIDNATLQFGGGTSPLNLNARRGFAIGPVSGTSTATFDTVTTPTTNPGVVNVQGPISDNTDGTTTGSGRLVKIGGQVLQLSAANTYSGGTSVLAGTLQVTNTTGSGTGTGPVSVTGNGVLASGGTLGGGNAAGTAGIITGNVAISTPDSAPATQGGNLSPGTIVAGSTAPVIGTLTLGPTSVMTWNPKGGYLFEHNPLATNPATPGTDNDTINPAAAPNGTLDLTALTSASRFSIGLTPTSLPANPTSTPVTYTAGTFSTVNLPSGTFGTVNLANGVNNATDVSSLFNFAGFGVAPIAAVNNGVLYFQFTPVPEPASVLCACGLTAGLAAWRRRRFVVAV